MKKDFYIPSNGSGNIYCRYWMPTEKPIGVIQLVHGIAEHIDRYNDFADFLCSKGFVVAAEDHMGHGRSMDSGSVQGYFHSGWFAAVDDTLNLTKKIQGDFAGLPVVVFGHSMGSFMTRTILAKYPQSGIDAAVICGTGWQPAAILPIGILLCKLICKMGGETNPSQFLQNFIFGSYNQRIRNKRTDSDWLSRDVKSVDEYIADPKCGFIPSAGLVRDMLIGIQYIQRNDSLAAMNKGLPVLLVSGEEDPVGNYGKGVKTTAEKFDESGVKDVSCKLFPSCRHEILNEQNKEEVYSFILNWIQTRIK